MRLFPLLLSFWLLYATCQQIAFDVHYQACYGLALAERWPESIREGYTALNHGAWDPNVYYLIGRAFQESGNDGMASSYFRDMLAFYPHAWYAQEELGVCLAACAEGRDSITAEYVRSEAEVHLQAARNIYPTSRTHGNLGVLYAHQGRFSEALLELDKALRLDEGSREARENLERVRRIRK